MNRNTVFLTFTDKLLSSSGKSKRPILNGAIIFNEAGDMLRALGLSDPDPEFTKLYQRAHLDNRLRDADAAYERVVAHVRDTKGLTEI